MKKIIFIMLLLFSLCSCNKKTLDYEYKKPQSVYAYNILNNEIELIEIEYEINDYIDVFNLYTNNQNSLPVGYCSLCYTNLELISSNNDENVIRYYVNNYIRLVDDLEIFKSLIIKTNLLLFEKASLFINNGKIIWKIDKKSL